MSYKASQLATRTTTGGEVGRGGTTSLPSYNMADMQGHFRLRLGELTLSRIGESVLAGLLNFLGLVYFIC